MPYFKTGKLSGGMKRVLVKRILCSSSRGVLGSLQKTLRVFQQTDAIEPCLRFASRLASPLPSCMS